MATKEAKPTSIPRWARDYWIVESVKRNGTAGFDSCASKAVADKKAAKFKAQGRKILSVKLHGGPWRKDPKYAHLKSDPRYKTKERVVPFRPLKRTLPMISPHFRRLPR